MTKHPRPTPLLIVADTYAQACLYARETGRERSDWRLIRTPTDIRGRRDGDYVLLTIPGRRPPLSEIDNRLRILVALHAAGFGNIDPGAST